MEPKFWMVLVTGIIPLIVGALWYGPLLFEKAWMKASNMTEEKVKSGNMAVIFGLTYVLAVMLSLMISQIAIHQSAIFGLFATAPEFKDATSEMSVMVNDLMAKYGDRHRSFGHGAVHGIFATVLFVLPVIGINGLFERKGWKYIFIHVGYWLVSLMLIGGVLCQFM